MSIYIKKSVAVKYFVNRDSFRDPGTAVRTVRYPPRSVLGTRYRVQCSV